MLNVSGETCLDSLTRLFVLGKEFIMSEEATNVEEPIVNEEGGQASNKDKQEQPKTFTQSDLDREVDRRLAKQQEKLDQQIQEAKEAGKSEGQKLAAMTEKERKDAELSQKEQEIADREATLQKRELTASISDELVKQGLPTGLANSLVELGDADAIHGTIETIQSAIEQGINDGVNERLRTEAPKNGGSNVDGTDDPFAQVMNKYK